MREEAVYAYRFEGKRYDCGNKLGYLQATVEYALGHPALGRSFRKYLQNLDLSAGDGARAKGNGLGERAAPRPRAGGRRRAARTVSAARKSQ
jgi:hypothetical protein